MDRHVENCLQDFTSLCALLSVCLPSEDSLNKADRAKHTEDGNERHVSADDYFHTSKCSSRSLQNEVKFSKSSQHKLEAQCSQRSKTNGFLRLNGQLGQTSISL